MRAFSVLFVFGGVSLLAQRDKPESQVVEAAVNGFQIKMSIPCKAKPEVVYGSMVNHLSEWWDASHSYTQDAKNMSIEAKPHGWFIEKLPEGGFVRHFEIVYLAPGKTIRFEGGMGPLQEQGIAGSMTINFKPTDSGSTIDLTYNVGGFIVGGEKTMKQWAPPVKQVIQGQFERLRDHANTAVSDTPAVRSPR